MAAIVIDVRSKFKRTYFPNRGDRAAGAELLLLYLERASDRRQNPREIDTIPRPRIATTEREKKKKEQYMFLICFKYSVVKIIEELRLYYTLLSHTRDY